MSLKGRMLRQLTFCQHNAVLLFSFASSFRSKEFSMNYLLLLSESSLVFVLCRQVSNVSTKGFSPRQLHFLDAKFDYQFRPVLASRLDLSFAPNNVFLTRFRIPLHVRSVFLRMTVTANHGDVASEKLIPSVTKHTTSGIVYNFYNTHVVNFKHGIKGCVDHALRQGLPFSQLSLLLFEQGQVLDKAAKVALAGTGIRDFLDPNFTGKLSSILFPGREFSLFSNNLFLTRLHVIPHVLVVIFSVTSSANHFDVVADQFAFRVAKQNTRGIVRGADGTITVRGENWIKGVIHNFTHTLVLAANECGVVAPTAAGTRGWWLLGPMDVALGSRRGAILHDDATVGDGLPVLVVAPQKVGHFARRRRRLLKQKVTGSPVHVQDRAIVREQDGAFRGGIQNRREQLCGIAQGSRISITGCCGHDEGIQFKPVKVYATTVFYGLSQ